MLSIRRFLLFYLLVSLTAILLIIAVLNFYISSRAMSHDFDMQLAQTTNLLATALDHPLNNKEIDALQQEFIGVLTNAYVPPFSFQMSIKTPTKDYVRV
ncbi:MAG: hypothetical protein GY782_07165 [Gammaproteobacteria bacterium]|nr:hypothetical protein [Gammaproteobacteria bacterium]